MYLRKVVMLNLFASLTMSQEKLGSDIDGEASGDRSGYSVSLDSDGDLVATGTYFLRLITANQTFTQKVTYVK